MPQTKDSNASRGQPKKKKSVLTKENLERIEKKYNDIVLIIGKCDEEKTKVKVLMEGLGTNERGKKADLGKMKTDYA